MIFKWFWSGRKAHKFYSAAAGWSQPFCEGDIPVFVLGRKDTSYFEQVGKGNDFQAANAKAGDRADCRRVIS